MKRILYLAIITLLLTMLNSNIFGAVPDSCLTLIWPDSPPDSYNPDYIMKDTCKDSPTYGEWYARGTFMIRMKDYIFSRLIEKAGSASVDDIDSVRYKKEKEVYQYLENLYGIIEFFRDPDECLNGYDSLFLLYTCLDVEFSRYNRRTDEMDSLYLVPGTKAVISKYNPYPTNVDENNDIKNVTLIPNPCLYKLKLVNLDDSMKVYRHLIIYNYLGISILTFDIPFGTNNFEIDVSSLNEGLYFIKINNNLLKFIKLR